MLETVGMLSVRMLRQNRDERRLYAALSFDLSEGEQVAVVGTSGSGKTTLLRGLAGLAATAGGEILLDGKTLAAHGPSAWRSQVVYVPQCPPSIETTGNELVQRVTTFASHRQNQDRHCWLERAHSIADSWALPPERWSRDYQSLSLGERQRLYLAVVLAMRPRVLLLDEPTTALDSASKRRVEAALMQFAGVWVTHDEEQLKRLNSPQISLSA